MKKLITIALASFFLFFNTAPTVKALLKPPVVSADSVVLMDATTGKLLYEKNKDSAYPPASTTKIMTILLVLENSNLNDVVTVSKNAEMTDGSKIYLLKDEKVSVKELLYGLILASANDCAVALAEHISGSTGKFAKLMNEKAESLGCKNTNFVNPNGLYDVNHKTSAYDLSLIMQELTNHPEYNMISTTPSYKMAATNKSKENRPLWNENRLIQKNDPHYYKGCEGGKTGYTIQSQHSFIAVASRNGQKLIVSLVHDSEKTFFPDSKKLLDYGFDNFELYKQFNKNDKVSNLTLDDGTNVPLLASTDLYIVKSKNPTLTPTIKTEGKKIGLSPIKKGVLISNATITYGKDSYSLDLTSGIDYAKKHVQTPSLSTNTINALKYLALALALLLFVIISKKRKIGKRRNIIEYIPRHFK
ncbi:D-alanyl-D-alanine carboxypeptidase [Clostridium sp. CF011]|uniref:D-alanyl-D-alanine carboxypeptidase family protein n=1 Tax=Clostridium sp. CF011 TaxID=2843318 RepID=UPI001C0B64ED|nr:D-alanyl-D-alanine carboxypeptidase family protein [Clostridium sp. CF011]MBU3090690.1 D-alanyl-D-alanine carboxypeptidase [Clostridium sp. CF011]WAG70041.1 D-alanyl-D-alanine carboxypeptidase [Clostridium sp. CF011]